MRKDEFITPALLRPRWKVKKSQLLALPEHQYDNRPKRINREYQMRLSVHEISGIPILKTTLFDEYGVAQVYIFCDKEAERDISYLIGGERWSEACLENLGISYKGRSYRRHDITYYIEYATKAEESLAAEYFGYSCIPSVEAILQFQYESRNIKLKLQHERSKQRIEALMSQLKPLPKDIDRFITNQLLNHHRYIFYKRKGKKLTGICSHCRQVVTLDAKGKKHNSKTRCPHCHSAVQLKAEGKVKYSVDKRDYFVLVNKINTGIILRRFYVSSKINIHGEERYMYEDARALITFNNPKVTYYLRDNTRKDIQWHKQEISGRYGYYYNANTPSFHFTPYTKNINRELKNTPFEYSDLKQAIQHIDRRIDISDYLVCWVNKPYIERLLNARLYNLAKDVFNNRVHFAHASSTKLYQLLDVRKSDIKVIQEHNFNAAQLKLYKLVIGEPEPLLWVNAAPPEHIKCFTDVIKRGISRFGINVMRRVVFEYAATQEYDSSIDNFISDWLDYTEQCEELNYNMEDTMVLYPHNLLHSHEITTRKIDKKKSLIIDKQIRHRFKHDLQKYKFKSGEYFVTIPRNQADLITEGKMLCHCVGGYDSKVACGKTTILFIRSVSNPTIPLATAEFCNGHVVQIRAYRNSTPNDDVMKFFEEYKTKVLCELSKKAS